MKLGVNFPPIIADDINFHIYDDYVKLDPGIYICTHKNPSSSLESR